MDLPRRASEWPFAGAGEEEPSRGQLLTGLGQGGTTARPLDSGVLTRWGARAPMRGPATAPWSLHRLRSLSVAAVVALRRGRRESEEREWEVPNGIRVFGRRLASAF